MLSGFWYAVSGRIIGTVWRFRMCRYSGGRKRGPRMGIPLGKLGGRVPFLEFPSHFVSRYMKPTYSTTWASHSSCTTVADWCRVVSLRCFTQAFKRASTCHFVCQAFVATQANLLTDAFHFSSKSFLFLVSTADEFLIIDSTISGSKVDMKTWSVVLVEM